MIQVAAQIRILVAVEAIDGRKGIDSIAQLCREKLNADPFSGFLFIFRTRRGTAIRVLQFDGQGFGWPQNVCPRDVLNGGPLARSRHACCERIRLSCCSLPVIRRQKHRRHGGR